MNSKYKNILACDTTGHECVVTVYKNGKVFTKSVESKRHALVISDLMVEVMGQAGLNYEQLDGVLVNQGPAAFTGLRVAMAAAQGLVVGRDIDIFTFSNLEIWAYGLYYFLKNRAIDFEREKNKSLKIMVGLDARMNEMYFGCYQVHLGSGNIENIYYDCILRPKDKPDDALRAVFQTEEPCFFVGPGWFEYKNDLTDVYSTALTKAKKEDLWLEEDFFDTSELKKTEIMHHLFNQRIDSQSGHTFNKNQLNYVRSNVAKKPKKVD